MRRLRKTQAGRVTQWEAVLGVTDRALARVRSTRVFPLRVCRTVAVPHRVGYAFFEDSEIAGAFSYLMAIGAAPDPAFVIALQEIPDHCSPL